MRYVTCPNCGKRLLKGEVGTNIEMECGKCGDTVSLIIEAKELIIKTFEVNRHGAK